MIRTEAYCSPELKGSKANSLGGLPLVADHNGKLIHGRYHVTSRHKCAHIAVGDCRMQ